MEFKNMLIDPVEFFNKNPDMKYQKPEDLYVVSRKKYYINSNNYGNTKNYPIFKDNRVKINSIQFNKIRDDKDYIKIKREFGFFQDLYSIYYQISKLYEENKLDSPNRKQINFEEEFVDLLSPLSPIEETNLNIKNTYSFENSVLKYRKYFKCLEIENNYLELGWPYNNLGEIFEDSEYVIRYKIPIDIVKEFKNSDINWESIKCFCKSLGFSYSKT